MLLENSSWKYCRPNFSTLPGGCLNPFPQTSNIR